MHWKIYITDAPDLLHVLALNGCHHQGVFTALEILLSKMVRCTQHTYLHTDTTHKVLECYNNSGDTYSSSMFAVIGFLVISVCTHSTARTPSISRFRGGLWTISNRLVKIVITPSHMLHEAQDIYLPFL